MPVKAAYLLLSILKAPKASTFAVSPLLYFFIKTSRCTRLLFSGAKIWVKSPYLQMLVDQNHFLIPSRIFRPQYSLRSSKLNKCPLFFIQFLKAIVDNAFPTFIDQNHCM